MTKITTDSPLTQLKGVGISQYNKFLKLGLSTVGDLLFHIPFRYRDTSEILTIEDFKDLVEGTFLAQIVEVKNIYTKTRKVLTKVKVADSTSTLDISYFNQSYLTKSLQVGEWYIFDGKITEKGRSKNVYNPKYEKFTGNISKQTHLGKIIGIYHQTEGISSRTIRNILNELKDDIDYLLTDPLTEYLPKDLNTLQKSIFQIHFPSSQEELLKARKRLEFDEMLNIALKLEKEKQEKNKLKADPIVEDNNVSKKFFKSLPFELTKDQYKSIEEIKEDMAKRRPMIRLLNGDVGSGKTVVAAFACLQAISNGYSAVVLAPTTVLAQQHYETLNKILKPFNVDIELWISSKKLKKDSEKKLVVGTHAILFRKDIPQNINLVIVDEQHRFGVEQREKLIKENSKTPHYLTMTATPIPRSLTEVVFGNTEVSLIKEKPSNRKEVNTKYVPYRKRNNCLDWIANKIKDSNYNEQAFIVYPLIEESENFDAKAVLTEFENLKNNNFKDIKIELLHGKLKEKEKTEILERYRNKEFNILVTTSVIEVGIDIPDATIMVIEDAHRFGLAQLHQLRGRVGRGDKQSYCFVIANQTEEEKSEVIDRLKYFSSHNSGFDVADYDLQRRGPGEVYGTKQSGIPQLKLASLTNIELFKEAKSVARNILKRDNIDLEYIYNNIFK
jgi:ATP-dependent DNA helicase RecG